MSDIHEQMIEIPNYGGKYFLDVSEEPYRIWSRRRAGCSGLHIKIEMYGRRRFASLLNDNGISELKPISDLSWAAHNPIDNMKELIVTFKDRNVQNEHISNLSTSPRYIRDDDGKVIVSFS